MRGLRCITLLLACAVAASAGAQSPQITVVAGDSIPQTTTVPVQQPAVQLTERTTVYEQPDEGMNRSERRALKARRFAQRIDSLVQGRDYMFVPNTMQQLPGGLIRSIYADFFYYGLFVDHVEVHLPTERGITQYVEMLNFDSMNLRNYQASRMQWGWNVTFNVTDGEVCYAVNIDVSTMTGEAVLTLLTPSLTMRYVGWLWDGGRRPEDVRRR